MNIIGKAIQAEYPSLNSLNWPYPSPEWLWERLEDKKVMCRACRHSCIIPPGRTGFCTARENREGVMYPRAFGLVERLHVDPFGYEGNIPAMQVCGLFCNFRCRFCFAYTWISMKKELPMCSGFMFPFNGKQIVDKEIVTSCMMATPETVAQLCWEQNIKHIVIAGNEPTVSLEYTMHLADMARKYGLTTCVATNGYSSKAVTQYYAKNIDRVSVGAKTLDQSAFDKVVSPGKKVDVNGILENLIILHEYNANFRISLMADGEHADPEETCRVMGKLRDAIGREEAVKIPVGVYPVQRYTNRRVVFDAVTKGIVEDHLNVRPGDIIGALELEVALKRMGFENTQTHYSADYKSIHGDYPSFFPEEAKCGRLAAIEKKPVDNSLRSYVFLGKGFEEAPVLKAANHDKPEGGV